MGLFDKQSILAFFALAWLSWHLSLANEEGGSNHPCFFSEWISECGRAVLIDLNFNFVQVIQMTTKRVTYQNNPMV